jgi:hypothetical protein
MGARSVFENVIDDSDSARIPVFTLVLYVVLFAAAVVISFLDIATGRINQLLLSVPIAFMLLIAIISDRKVAHIPPMLIVSMVIALALAAVSDFLQFHEFFSTLSSVLTGVSLMMMGLVFVYTVMHSYPRMFKENRFFIYVSAFSISMTVLLVMFIIQLVYYHLIEDEGFEVWIATEYVMLAMLGAILTMALTELGLEKFLINSGLNKKLESYVPDVYSNEKAKEGLLEIIKAGESEKLEFKSTITTNIATGENDKRMEKAVLKSIVAFLNTSGGILLIGVSDDGSIYGVDEDQFPSRDKMNQHLSHMISSKIGSEYFAYVSFTIIDMEEGKAVIRVDCDKSKKPVFLKDGKAEEFYVRSGPASIELTGSNLVNYVSNNSVSTKRSIIKQVESSLYENNE